MKMSYTAENGFLIFGLRGIDLARIRKMKNRTRLKNQIMVSKQPCTMGPKDQPTGMTVY